ncbi:unnamed protein product [Blepharisma stoltei]|uniref:Uncharacterized protein n=1 Tax=Blepharisma stoltei TaxID=1481888 RepID=A0AAU9J9L3_9CILI|nr:unnamed protein product [Blepharisma stoltei]
MASELNYSNICLLVLGGRELVAKHAGWSPSRINTELEINDLSSLKFVESISKLIYLAIEEAGNSGAEKVVSEYGLPWKVAKLMQLNKGKKSGHNIFTIPQYSNQTKENK